MVTLNRIYTKTGDKGDTALGDGTRVSKDSVRVAAYGTVDELNSALGVSRLYAVEDFQDAIERIQNDLFDIGADLCRPPGHDENLGYEPLRATAAQVDRLEAEIDLMNGNLEPLKSFVLPGGSALAAHLHVCRTVCRRAERGCVTLAGVEEVNTNVIKYLNRLSDWFFVASRVANNNGADDILWTPGANR